MSNKHELTGESPECSDREDINESFEKLLLAEEIAETAGYEEGYGAGSKQIVTGYHLGYHRSSLVAARLGYYYGVLRYCTNERLFGERAVRQANELQKALDDFPRRNDDSVDIWKKVEDIKFKYNKLCSLTKMDASYPEVEKLEY